MKIGIDIMGGDNAPMAPLKAAIKYAHDNENIEVVIYGDEDVIKQNTDYPSNITKVFTTQVISIDDDAALAIRKKKDSSIVVACQQLKEKQLNAFVSSGSTGALVAAGVFVTKRIKGIDRPSLPGIFPKKDGSNVILLDLGANPEPTEKHFVDNAVVAQAYAKTVLGIKNPKVKLLNIGEEAKKGTELYKKVFDQLSENENINFQGNIEARYLFDNDCDIIVMDGFTGNMVLKSIEGFMKFNQSILKDVFLKNLKNKIAAMIVKKDLKDKMSEFDYKKTGGTPLFGINEVMIKAHGSSNEEALYNALGQAKSTVESNYIDLIKGELKNE